MTGAAAHIVRRAEKSGNDDGENLLLSISAADALAAELSMSRREVEIIALKNGVIPRRYQRNMGTLGAEGQVALLESSVSVIGLGGLGGFTCELLARAGVGEMILVDGDVYDESNLNRQLHCTEEDIGEVKAAAAERRVTKVNGAVKVRHHLGVLNEDNARSILGSSRVVVDCLDNIPDRFILQRACRSLGIPMVHGAVAGTMGQVMVIPPGGGGLEHLYGRAEDTGRHGIELVLGNLPATVATIAALQCNEVVRIITGRSHSRGVLFVDLTSDSFTRVEFS
ncbi:MAG: HesA/MoeB/ThiF family protein [Bacillota bacterium]